MDIAFRQEMKIHEKRFPLFVQLRMEGGSGFRMACILREFFREYLNRISSYGPWDSLPSSVNVMRGFFSFDDEFGILDLRPEREYLLRLHDYFDWYTAERTIPLVPRILLDTMEEDVIYSFDLFGDTGEYAISKGDSRLAIAGVSMIRYKDELSVILLSGENPPYPPDVIIDSVSEMAPAKGREHICRELLSSSSLSMKDRYLDGMPGFGKVLLLSRFDLLRNKFDVRYVNLDCGATYMIFTDDPQAFHECDEETLREKLEAGSVIEMPRYNQLFSALSSLIYLPVLFIAEPKRVVESKFITELGISNQKRVARQGAKEFGKAAVRKHRIVRCLTVRIPDNPVEGSTQRIIPPDLEFESTGFWKPLGPDEIGTDKNGNAVRGKTWVERTESFTVTNLESFVMRNHPAIASGTDPGVIYVIRSPSHGIDMYKVGLSRRNARERVSELSSVSGVPLPFEVLASWNVADCNVIEKEVHRRLASYRVSKRREFFRTSLSAIIAAVEKAIVDME